MTDTVDSLRPHASLPAEYPAARPRRRTALVTGGSGYIGKYLVAALVEQGYFVRILDVAPPTEQVPNTEYVAGSILDDTTVGGAVRGVDTVFHLAAIAHLWAADVDDFDHINRRGTEIVLAAARSARVRRFIHCSSEAVLFAPEPTGGAVDETATVDLADMPGPYTRSKLAAERAALAAARSGLNVVVVSPAIPVGPGDHNLTPPTAMLMHLKEHPSFYLDCILNLVDVRDVATGMVLAAERGRVGERYVLGGESVSFQDLLYLLEPQHNALKKAKRIPAAIALVAGAVDEWIATHVTHRRPAATVEGVRLAVRSVPVSSHKAQRELGYVPSPVRLALSQSWFTLGQTAAIAAQHLDRVS
jgi:dihydroflavonol-4-reductase